MSNGEMISDVQLHLETHNSLGLDGLHPWELRELADVWGGRCFKIWFYFSLPYTDLIGKKFDFPKVSLFCPWQQLVSDFSLSLI